MQHRHGHMLVAPRAQTRACRLLRAMAQPPDLDLDLLKFPARMYRTQDAGRRRLTLHRRIYQGAPWVACLPSGRRLQAFLPAEVVVTNSRPPDV
jgi:hypothetical protein